MREIFAKTVADDLVEFLQKHPGQLASVHSVFPHAVNILVGENDLVTLTNLDDITPMGLRVDCGVSFAELLKAGDKVMLDTDRFAAADETFSVHLRKAQVWESKLRMNLAARPAEDGAQVRRTLVSWLGEQPAQGLLPLLPRLTHQSMRSRPAVDNLYSRYIAGDLEAFNDAVKKSNWEHALTRADRLIGFGMGSTPACDDFLAAYLVVFNIAEVLNPGYISWIREFNQAIATKAKYRTTLISANMLRHAADGKISRSHQELIQACLFENENDLVQLAHRVMQHGATSGGDFLLGLVCALEWYHHIMTNTGKEGERAWVELNQLQPVPGI